MAHEISMLIPDPSQRDREIHDGSQEPPCSLNRDIKEVMM